MIDTSTFTAAGEVEVAIDASVVVKAGALQAWRTVASADGWRGFWGADADIQVAIGGRYEIWFDPDQPAGLRGSEGCRMLAYVPGAMLAFSWNAPPELPQVRGLHTWVVMTFDETAPGSTCVRVRHLGFGRGGQWEDNVAYFRRAWPRVLDRLAEHLGRG